MAELKTKENNASVSAFLAAIPDAQRREDALKVAAMMKAVTKTEPKMWGAAIVGYGSQHYNTRRARGGLARIAFSPRKDALTLHHEQLRAVLGVDGQTRKVQDRQVVSLHQTPHRCRRDGAEAAAHASAEGASPRGKVTKSARLPGEKRVFGGAIL